jgi:hypothetical protein
VHQAQSALLFLVEGGMHHRASLGSLISRW